MPLLVICCHFLIYLNVYKDKELEIQLYKYLILENTVVQHQNLYKCNHPHVPSYVQQGFGNWNALK